MNSIFSLKIFLALPFMAISVLAPLLAMQPQDQQEQIRAARLQFFAPEEQAAEDAAAQPADAEMRNDQQLLEDEDAILRDLLAAKWQAYLLLNPSSAAATEEQPNDQKMRCEIIRSRLLHVLDNLDRNRQLKDELVIVYVITTIVEKNDLPLLLKLNQIDPINHLHDAILIEGATKRLIFMHLSSLVRTLRERDEQRHQRPIPLAAIAAQQADPSDDTVNEDDPVCIICRDKPRDPIVTCQENMEHPHICCRDCLLAWEEVRDGQLTCPLCNRDLRRLQLRQPLIKCQALNPQLRQIFRALEQTPKYRIFLRNFLRELTAATRHLGTEIRNDLSNNIRKHKIRSYFLLAVSLLAFINAGEQTGWNLEQTSAALFIISYVCFLGLMQR